MLSFVMPAFKARYLRTAIEGILNQTSPDWELIIVDDCSPEDLCSIVGEFDDKRIRYYRNDVNLGGENLVNQWNHCVGYANGEWIVMAADDDIYDARFCEKVLELARKYPAVDLIRARVEQIGEDGSHLFDDGVFPEFSSSYRYLNDWMTGRAFTCVGNLVFRRSALLGIGGFVQFPCAFCSDIATPIVLAANGAANTSDMLFKFRHSSIHLSGSASRLKDKLEAMTRFYDWLDSFEYPEPSSKEDEQFYSIKNSGYIQSKCIYDYFNHIIINVSLYSLPEYLQLCRRAGVKEKFIMTLRWIKSRIRTNPGI